jgi:hypothetical protein
MCAHLTLFRARKETDFNPTTVGQRARSVVESFAADYHAEAAAGTVIALHVAPNSNPARRQTKVLAGDRRDRQSEYGLGTQE